MPNYDDKKILNFVPIDEATFERLKNGANKEGTFLSDYVGSFLDEQTWIAPTEDEIDRRLFWNHQASVIEEKQHRWLYRMATIHSEHPTRKSADRLQEQCDLMNVNYDELLERTRSDLFASIARTSKTSTKFVDCLHWLTATIQESSNEVMVRELKMAANSRGFNWSMIERVRDHINSDSGSPRIDSSKRGRCWYWTIDTESDKE